MISLTVGGCNSILNCFMMTNSLISLSRGCFYNFVTKQGNIWNNDINDGFPVNSLLKKSHLVSSIPYATNEVNNARCYHNLTLRGPTSITKTHDIFHRCELQCSLKQIPKPYPQSNNKITLIKRGFFFFLLQFEHIEGSLHHLEVRLSSFDSLLCINLQQRRDL